MIQKVCSNPECQAVYSVDENLDDSMGCCGFDCWEKMHCHCPEEVQFEKIEL
jgi:hypothetical protein